MRQPLTSGCCTIMTRYTGTIYLRMINRHGWLPHGGRMTVLAGRAGGYVVADLAGGGDAVVAADAVAGDPGMIEARQA